MDKNKQRKLLGFSVTTLLSALLLFFIVGCEKLPLKPEGELITQTFGLYTSSNIPDKSWDFNSWIWNYNTTPATLTLTGTGASIGNNYTLETTIQALVNGTASIQMLRGTYDITYTTPHQISSNSLFLNGQLSSIVLNNPQDYAHLSENIDIKVEMFGVSVEGTPITLTSTVNDVLIVVDIPTLEKVMLSVSGSSFNTNLIKDNSDFHWGYFAMNDFERGLMGNLGLRLLFTIDGVEKYVEAKDFQLGKVYHIQSNLGATITLDIPDMTVETLIVE